MINYLFYHGFDQFCDGFSSIIQCKAVLCRIPSWLDVSESFVLCLTDNHVCFPWEIFLTISFWQVYFYQVHGEVCFEAFWKGNNFGYK